ncbi:NAD(P)/FAD-dependent oxidoreductase [Reyranella sp.]|uniref:NAD(P)/FAD-dependent oxidoreductase n=1 Tax=Reyranella sp. TaxID=1929291 RepID=UPI003D131837
MRIAVIGAGIAGLGAAWSLCRDHEIVLYEREERLGGHACTVDVPTPRGPQPVDMGFIIYNERNDPNLGALFDHLGVPTEESDLSFAVSVDDGAFEYGSSCANYFAQRINLARPSFLRMTRDILRFNRQAPRLLEQAEDLDFTLGDFIAAARFGQAFRDRYLVPMAACIWSSPVNRMLDYPAQPFVRFFHNHDLLTLGPQRRWRTVKGGSRSYVDRLAAPLLKDATIAPEAIGVRRGHDGVWIKDAGGHWGCFDKVVLACHADQALGLLIDPDQREGMLLGSFAYSSNEVWLHGDPGLMPRRRDVWSSWNYVSESQPTDGKASVTYWMNRLQNFPEDLPLFVSVNPMRTPAMGQAHARQVFQHPMFDPAAIRAQRNLHEIQGVRDTYFCGSYCGYGFHEDALSAGLDIAERLGARRPWARPAELRAIGAAPRVVADRLRSQPLSRPAAARLS